MASLDTRRTSHSNTAIGPYRDKKLITVGTADYERPTGFTCTVSTAGDLTYRTLEGDTDQTETGLAIGDTIIGPGGIPVLLQVVRSNSTVTSIIIGIL